MRSFHLKIPRVSIKILGGGGGYGDGRVEKKGKSSKESSKAWRSPDVESQEPRGVSWGLCWASLDCPIILNLAVPQRAPGSSKDELIYFASCSI